jgi:hypothetical protein
MNKSMFFKMMKFVRVVAQLVGPLEAVECRSPLAVASFLGMSIAPGWPWQRPITVRVQARPHGDRRECLR